MVKSYQMIFNDKLITYDVHYKNMKSINMRVKEGKLVVSAPYYTSHHYIEDTILKYQKKLLPQLMDYDPYVLYSEDGYVDIFAQRYQICLRDVNKRQCALHEHSLYVYHNKMQECVESYLKKVLLNYIEERVIAYLAYDFDLNMPHIEIKKYKGRWGSCFYKENKITFSLSLVHLEKDLIDYVIVHELSHFLQANHSSLFYQEIEKRIPDYKQRVKRLKEKHI